MSADFVSHNRMVKEVWDSYHQGNPVRVPMMLGTSVRSYLSDPALNMNRISYCDYHNDADIMMRVQLAHSDYVRHNLYADHEMGLPEAWKIAVDGGNFHHSAWYGCEVYYSDLDSPDTKPLLDESNKNLLFDQGIPDPFGGIYGTFRKLHERLREKIKGFAYKGVPISPDIAVPAAWLGGSGVPFTTACKIRGAASMCMDMVLDPDYAKQLLAFITEAAIERTKAWRSYLGLPIKSDVISLGDDSVILLSPEMYREFVLPFHKRLYEEFGTEGSVRSIHLCGNAAKHFEMLAKELNVSIFDTGFPIDLKRLYETLGSAVTIQGGLHIETIRTASPEEIDHESKLILEAVKPYKTFVFRDANHLPPRVPPGSLRAMYEACKRYGVYNP